MAQPHESLTRAASLQGGLADAAYTITAAVATDTPVARRDARGAYLEILDPAGVDLASLDVPLIDSHRTGTIRATLGRADNFRRDGNAILADLTFSTAGDVAPVVQRVRDGTAPHVSVAYSVAEWAETMQGGQRVKRAVRWMISEVSTVSVPADPNARKRTMATETDDLAEDATPDDIRKAAQAEMQKRAAPRLRITRDHTDPATITRRKSDAMAFRMAGGTMPDDAREFVPMCFRDFAADALTRAGESVRGQSADEILTRAGQLTTSDYSLVVSNAMKKVALAAYQAAESPIEQLSRQRTLPNFKDSTSIRLGELGKLAELTESGEITATSRAESGEVMRVSTFARRVDVSRKLQLDDDLNLLGDMTVALGQAAAQTQADIFASLVVGNPDLRDGDPVFDAGRGNVSTPAALSVASLGLARRAMPERKGIDGVTPISATPFALLVGPELETLAEQVLSSIYAADVSDVNPFAGKLKLLVEPRITGNDWWVFSDPARLPTLQHAYLSSAQGVQIQRQEAWNTLGLSFRAFLDFGAGWVDWRGARYNAGA